MNTFVVLAGPSGAGKGTSESAARDAISFRWHHGGVVDLPEFPIGSGEGVSRTFMPPTPGKGKDGIEAQAEQITTAVFSVPEVDTAAGLFSRSGSTLEGELRKVFSGEQLGFTNAQAHTRTRVAAHSYRCGLIVGVQPGRAGALLDGADGGTPQRFVWLPVLDADAPEERPAEPAPVVVTQPRFSGDLAVPEVARQAIDAHQLAMHRGEVDPLDGHKLLVRLKVATALMVLDGRDGQPALSDEDWHLAGVVMAMSDRTRAWVQQQRVEASRRVNRGRALATAERDEVISDRKLQRAKEAVLRWLARASGETFGADLRRRLKADLRVNFAPAVSELADEGRIIVIETDRGSRYRLMPESTPCTESTPVYSQVNSGVPEVHGVPPAYVAEVDSASSSSDAEEAGRQSPVAAQTPTPSEEPMNPPRPKICRRCNVSLPKAATRPLCDDCDGAPPRPPATRKASETKPLRVVHGGADRADGPLLQLPLSK
ncbi:hypothetical protein [Mycobacterium europaeum]|uniref:hypothetical protein n=1 Tax=Mycobacterium europaeum TaxID=761804 RepID=UPI001B80E35F|nr:hypothetical protein [Mycobacterium europaeum]